jgi:D-threo-aldose 1-dehydrogenase
MNALDRSQIGRTQVSVTRLGLGGTGLGNLYAAVEESEGLATVTTALEMGIRYFDTAPAYGNGLAERRLGTALAAADRDQFVISSKVGYALKPLTAGEAGAEMWDEGLPFKAELDFSPDAIRRSLEGTLERLGSDRVEMVAIHDPDEVASVEPGLDPYARSHFEEAMRDAYPVLDELRAEGLIGAVGVGMNGWQMLLDFADAGQFDYFLLAGRYTLLEQEALEQFLPTCEEKQISVILGGAYSSGILATGARPDARYNYKPASPEILERVARLERVCERHGVPLRAAALQFSAAHPVVASVIPGARSPEELRDNVEQLERPIPAELWAELKEQSLIAAEAPVPVTG